jgi:hypothetical protein
MRQLPSSSGEAEAGATGSAAGVAHEDVNITAIQTALRHEFVLTFIMLPRISPAAVDGAVGETASQPVELRL